MGREKGKSAEVDKFDWRHEKVEEMKGREKHRGRSGGRGAEKKKLFISITETR